MLLMTFATKSLSSVSVGAARVATLTLRPVNAIVKALIHRREVVATKIVDCGVDLQVVIELQITDCP